MFQSSALCVYSVETEMEGQRVMDMTFRSYLEASKIHKVCEYISDWRLSSGSPV